MLSAKRLGVIAASTLISAGALLGFSAGSASATPNFCNGNYLCANVAAQTYTTLYIHMWSARYTFRGHFELQTPEGAPYNSNNTSNGPSSGPTFAVPIVYGWYCATAWKENSTTSYTELGHICFVSGS